jgi:hypothetical protein
LKSLEIIETINEKAQQPTKVFAIAGRDGRAIGSSNIIQLQLGGDGMLFGYYFLPSTFVFQIGICTGLDVQ